MATAQYLESLGTESDAEMLAPPLPEKKKVFLWKTHGLLEELFNLL